MKLVMTLLVRDEADVIEQNLEHHLAQGVDAFIVTDNGSLDDTLPILRRYEQRGLLELIEEPAQTYAGRVGHPDGRAGGGHQCGLGDPRRC